MVGHSFTPFYKFSFALIIPLTAFLITTNQKNVSASNFENGDYEHLEIDEPLTDIYFNNGYMYGFLPCTDTFIQYNYGSYQKTPLLHIPYLNSDYIVNGNSFNYNYTLDSTTIYSLTLSKYNDFMVMFSPSKTNYFTLEFNNLVLYTETAEGDEFNSSQFYIALRNYFTNHVQFIVSEPVDVNLRVDLNFVTDNVTVFDGYHYFNSISTKSSGVIEEFSNLFIGLFDGETGTDPNYSFGLLNGGFVDFVTSDTNVLDYYNGYFIIPKLVFTFEFSNDVIFYIRSRLANINMSAKDKYFYSLYQRELLTNILAYNGFGYFSDGYYVGFDKGYDKGYNDGAGDLTPFDAILNTVESFLNFKIFPNFPVYYFFLIAFGFALFGLIIKYAKGG